MVRSNMLFSEALKAQSGSCSSSAGDELTAFEDARLASVGSSITKLSLHQVVLEEKINC